MQLTFLGTRYTRIETTIAATETQQAGIFRGTRYTMAQAYVPQAASTLQLKYRGQSYSR